MWRTSAACLCLTISATALVVHKPHSHADAKPHEKAGHHHKEPDEESNQFPVETPCDKASLATFDRALANIDRKAKDSSWCLRAVTLGKFHGGALNETEGEDEAEYITQGLGSEHGHDPTFDHMSMCRCLLAVREVHLDAVPDCLAGPMAVKGTYGLGVQGGLTMRQISDKCLEEGYKPTRGEHLWGMCFTDVCDALREPTTPAPVQEELVQEESDQATEVSEELPAESEVEPAAEETPALAQEEPKPEIEYVIPESTEYVKPTHAADTPVQQTEAEAIAETPEKETPTLAQEESDQSAEATPDAEETPTLVAQEESTQSAEATTDAEETPTLAQEESDQSVEVTPDAEDTPALVEDQPGSQEGPAPETEEVTEQTTP